MFFKKVMLAGLVVCLCNDVKSSSPTSTFKHDKKDLQALVESLSDEDILLLNELLKKDDQALLSFNQIFGIAAGVTVMLCFCCMPYVLLGGACFIALLLEDDPCGTRTFLQKSHDNICTCIENCSNRTDSCLSDLCSKAWSRCRRNSYEKFKPIV